jgi:hypothetical protein
MKKLIIALTLIWCSVKSQDTIRFRNGESKAVKVSEVGLSEIHYNRFDNLTGPKYVASKNDIRYIKYAGGQIDSFAVAKSEPVHEAVIEQKPRPAYKQCDKFEIHGNVLYCNGMAVGESKLLKIISSSEANRKKNDMMLAYTAMKKHKKQQYLFGFVGLGLGLGIAYAGFIGAVFSEDPAPLVGGVLAGAAIGITGAVISGIHKSKRHAKKLEIAKIYNQD